jgi:hypothetical protein
MLITPQTSALTTPLSSGSCANPEPLQETQSSDPDHNREYCTNHGRFAGEVVAAIDVRAGIVPATVSHPVPFVDAPLFGLLNLEPATVVSESTTRALPSRVDAEGLAEIYFSCIDPLEPVLDKVRFSADVETAYCGQCTLSNTERDIRLSIMNLVFGLAVQRQESIPQVTRQDRGNLYFQRAWILLRPEIVLWQSTGSIELVQCLILMNRYLHCTSHQQKSWMTSGLAYRIAQSICCDLPGSSETVFASDRELKRQVWASCVALDRYVTLKPIQILHIPLTLI